MTRLLLAPVPWQVIFDIHALQERFYFGDNIIPVLLVSSPLHNTHNTHNTHNKQRQHCCPLGLPCPCPNPLAHHCRTCLTLLLSSALHTHPQPLMRLTHKHPEHIGPSLRGRGGGHTHAHGQSGVPLLLTKLEELTLSMPYNPETPNVSAAKSSVCVCVCVLEHVYLINIHMYTYIYIYIYILIKYTCMHTLTLRARAGRGAQGQ